MEAMQEHKPGQTRLRWAQAGAAMALWCLPALVLTLPRGLLPADDALLQPSDGQALYFNHSYVFHAPAEYTVAVSRIADDAAPGVGDAFTVDGIPTYVVGVGIEDVTSDQVQDGTPDNTNTFDRLNELAEDGGKPRDDPSEKFFNTNNELELAAALDQIAVDALTCIVPLDPAPVDPQETIVVLNGEVVPQVSDCQTETGWVYVNPEGPFDAIRMCGSACGGLKLTGSAEVTVCAVE